MSHMAQLPNGFWILISGDLEALYQGMIRYLLPHS